MLKALCFVAALSALASAAAFPGKQVGEIRCDSCKMGFWMLEEMVKSNATQHDIIIVLDQLCNLFAEPAKSECKKVVSAGVADIEAVIRIVTAVETPDEICHQIGACLGPAPTPTPEVPCKLCNAVVAEIQRWLADERSVEEIKQLVDAVCLLVPNATKRTICDEIAERGIDEVVALIEGKTPEQACQALKLCPSKTMCLTCDLVFTALESWLAQNKTETEIEHLLEEVCRLLPASDVQVCDKIIEIGVKEAVDFLRERESPYEACREIGACDGPAPVKKPCHECKYILGEVRDWVNDGLKPAQIDEQISDLCELLGSDYADVCKSVEELTAEKIIAMFQAGETEAQICKDIHIC